MEIILHENENYYHYQVARFDICCQIGVGRVEVCSKVVFFVER